MRLPEHITFTGADDSTKVETMVWLSQRFPVEWGVLFSRTRQGVHARYPGDEKLGEIVWHGGLTLAAHLCGRWSDAIMEGDLSHFIGKFPVDLGCFKRIQVNHLEPDVDAIEAFSKEWGPRCIAQTRDTLGFPRSAAVDWLFDRSAGNGLVVETCPPRPASGDLVGYAGGIDPDNVLRWIERVNADGRDGPYWLDMESGVRTDNLFDMKKVEAVCRAVYGRS
jgi:hypothetical protein